MLALLRSASKQPASPAISQQHVDGVAPSTSDTVVTTSDSAQDAPAPNASDPPVQSTHNIDPRPSDASMPTIASTPTIHGPPVDATETTLAKPRPTPIATSLAPPSPVIAEGSALSVHTQSSAHGDRPMQSQSQSALPYSPSGPNSTGKDPRRFSFPSFPFLRSDIKRNKKIPPPLQTKAASVSKGSQKKPTPTRSLSALIVGTAASSERRSKESAAVVRSVIVGNHNDAPQPGSSKAKLPSKSDVARVKAQLLDPKTAAKVISHLRTLSATPDDTATYTNPIHAVCLNMPEKDLHDRYFAQLPSVATASLSTVSAVLADVHLINLITAPNMGIGAPVTAQGLFAGALPTAETVIEGIEQITPELMALGYATGKSILPDHKGVIVPVDRISALTYWWGFEICLPPPTIAHLEASESPCTALLNLLTALSLLNEGVREIIPFIRYIAQFVQTEWSLVKKADKGKGVVCTATWLLPVALVPRPWDFTDPPPKPETGVAGQNTPASPSIQRFSTTLTTPKPSTEVPNGGAPRSSSAYSTETKAEEESLRPAISSQPPVLPELVVSSPGSIDGAHRGSGDEETHNAYNKAQHDGEAAGH